MGLQNCGAPQSTMPEMQLVISMWPKIQNEYIMDWTSYSSIPVHRATATSTHTVTLLVILIFDHLEAQHVIQTDI